MEQICLQWGGVVVRIGEEVSVEVMWVGVCETALGWGHGWARWRVSDGL